MDYRRRRCSRRRRVRGLMFGGIAWMEVLQCRRAVSVSREMEVVERAEQAWRARLDRDLQHGLTTAKSGEVFLVFACRSRGREYTLYCNVVCLYCECRMSVL
jgi:hypothetical protein